MTQDIKGRLELVRRGMKRGPLSAIQTLAGEALDHITALEAEVLQWTANSRENRMIAESAARREAAAVGTLRRIEEVAESRAAEGYNEAGRLKHIAEIARSALQAVKGGEKEQNKSSSCTDIAGQLDRAGPREVPEGWRCVPCEPTNEMVIASIVAVAEADADNISRLKQEHGFTTGMAVQIALGDGRLHRAAYCAAVEAAPNPAQGLRPNSGSSEPDWTAAAWRRGMMHAIERIDLVLKPGKPVPKGKMAATIEAIRATLDDLTEFQRQARPRTYEDAFDLCAADYAAARDGAERVQLGAEAKPKHRDALNPIPQEPKTHG